MSCKESQEFTYVCKLLKTEIERGLYSIIITTCYDVGKQINIKNIKLPPMPPPLPLVALFVPILLGIVPPKALAESQGVIIYFSTELVGILIRKENA